MNSAVRLSLVGISMLLTECAYAQTAPEDGAGPGGDVEIFYSADAEETDVARAAATVYWRYEDRTSYQGVRIERVSFNPQGLGWESRERVYVDLADNAPDWSWSLRAGTDGNTVLGAASMHNNAPLRLELFLERDIIETPRGLNEGIYQTFAGAAVDVPAGSRDTFTIVAGLQEFTGRNVRSHIRLNHVHLLDADRGLTAQVRTRYFRNSQPREADYYSPRWYAQVLPALQIRRYSDGWRYIAVAGYGVQRDSASDWRPSKFAEFRVTSPNVGSGLAIRAGAIYSDTSLTGGVGYSYLQANVGVTKSF